MIFKGFSRNILITCVIVILCTFPSIADSELTDIKHINMTKYSTHEKIRSDRRYYTKISIEMIKNKTNFKDGEEAVITCTCKMRLTCDFEWKYVTFKNREIKNYILSDKISHKGNMSQVIFKPTEHATIHCQANTSTTDYSNQIFVTIFMVDLNEPVEVWTNNPNKITEGVDLEITCAAHHPNYTSVNFFRNNIIVEEDSVKHFLDKKTNCSRRKILKFNYISKADSGIYECRARERRNLFSGYSAIQSKFIQINVQDDYTIVIFTAVTVGSILPILIIIIIILLRMKKNRNGDIKLESTKSRKVHYTTKINPNTSNSDQSSVHSYAILKDQRGILLEKLFSDPTIPQVSFDSDSEEFLEEEIPNLQPAVTQGPQSCYVTMPGFQKKPDKPKSILSDYEFPLQDLEFTRNLGAGNFGIVRHAFAHNLIPGEEKTPVAVKSPNRNNEDGKKALLSELEVMDYIGQHENIVNLLKVITINYDKSEFMIITEYCSLGSVLDFLKANKHKFIDEINPETKLFVSKFNLTTSQNLLTTSHLVIWSTQVARGMQFLASQGVIHGDLAARNILLYNSTCVKICDFGLARIKKNSNYYLKKSNTPIPIHWIAVETIRDWEFSTYSDIWSFGVVLWEFFSLGEEPYLKISGQDFCEEIEKGYRLTKPKHSTEALYNIMFSCWLEDRRKRPSFSEIEKSFTQMINGDSMCEQALNQGAFD